MQAVIERLYAALAAGDRAGVEAVLSPDISVTFAAGMPYGIGGTHHGADAIDEGWWAIGRRFAARAEPSEFVSIAAGRMLVIGEYVGTARATGTAFRAAFTHLIRIDEGRITELVQLTDTAQWNAALTPDLFA